MQNFKFNFLKNEFQADWDVRFKFHFKFHLPYIIFLRVFFPMYRGILEPQNYTSILHKNGSFSNKTCCGLTALLLKTKIYFCRCNFVNKQINENSQYLFRIDCSQYVEPKICQKIKVVLEMELQIYGHLLKMSLYNMTN